MNWLEILTTVLIDEPQLYPKVTDIISTRVGASAEEQAAAREEIRAQVVKLGHPDDYFETKADGA